MASNSFGTSFRITTFGESHGPAVGVVIDGCPSGLELSASDLLLDLQRRAPGTAPYVSPRRERDEPEILSGIYQGKTTGAPIAILFYNRDVKSEPYREESQVLKPGHAQFTYLARYGIFDPRGGGRASARETVCRVAAGAVAKKWLKERGVQIFATLDSVGELRREESAPRERVVTDAMIQLLEKVASEGDSVGGVVSFEILGALAGVGDPVYEKIEANLAKAMLSIPATKGFEIGEGFASTKMRGSLHNDPFASIEGAPQVKTNRAGGLLGGITTGAPIIGRVAFKPASSIRIPQESVTLKGETATFKLGEGARHDPCVAVRALPVVEAMAALVVIDAYLMKGIP